MSQLYPKQHICVLACLLVTLFASISTNAQGWEKRYSPTSGNFNYEDQMHSLVQTADDGFVMVGFTEGNTNGGTDAYVIRTDASGELLWEKTIGGNSQDFAEDIVADGSGNFIIVGSTESFTEGKKDIYIFKIDENGNLLWERNYGGIESDIATAIVADNNGEFAITGRTDSFGNGSQSKPDVFFIKIDTDGFLTSSFQVYGGTEFDEGTDLVAMQSDEFAIIGNTLSYGNGPSSNMLDIYLIITDENGNLTDEFTFGGFEKDKASAILQLSDNNFVFTGITNTDGSEQILLLKATVNGEEIWQQTYGGIHSDIGNDLTLAPDGGFAIIGTSELTAADVNIIFISTNAEGIEQQSCYLGGSQLDEGLGIITTTDGEFALCGYYGVGSGLGAMLNDPYLAKTDGSCNIFNNYISGNVFRDLDGDCLKDNDEQNLNDWLVKAENDQTAFYATTDEDGNYSMAIDSGTYSVSLVILNDTWGVCIDYPAISVIENDSFQLNFGAKVTVEDCPYMQVAISTPFLQPCNTNIYTIDYCNYGTVDAADAYVDVTFDEDLNVNYTSPPWSSIPNTNTYRFELGTIPEGTCGTIEANVTLSCEAIEGEAHCTQAYIHPDDFCIPANPLWDGASLKVEGSCEGDSAKFIITNVGTGSLTTALDYIVIEDVVIFREGNTPNLPHQEAVAANGAVYRMIADQPAGHPYETHATAVVDRCPLDQPFTENYVTLFADHDNSPFVDVDCRQSISNPGIADQTVSPGGYEAEHYITSIDEIEYHIQFQNTGTDTIRNIVIRDTLSEYLDVSTITAGASSHSYDFEVYNNGIVQFTFADIMLPPSIDDETASHGFVTFRAAQKPSNSVGAVIENTAVVTFDYFAPVVTNKTFVTIGGASVSDFLEIMVSTTHIAIEGVSIKNYPNPFSDYTTFELVGKTFQEIELKIYDTTGRLIRSEKHERPKFRLYSKELPTGMYFYKIEAAGQSVSTGKIIVRSRS